MTPNDLINEKQRLTQSDCTIIGKPFNVSNKELSILSHYYDYRLMGMKCGKPLNPLERLAMLVLEMHAHDLKNARLWEGIKTQMYNNRIEK